MTERNGMAPHKLNLLYPAPALEDARGSLAQVIAARPASEHREGKAVYAWVEMSEEEGVEETLGGAGLMVVEGEAEKIEGDRAGPRGGEAVEGEVRMKGLDLRREKSMGGGGGVNLRRERKGGYRRRWFDVGKTARGVSERGRDREEGGRARSPWSACRPSWGRTTWRAARLT